MYKGDQVPQLADLPQLGKPAAVLDKKKTSASCAFNGGASPLGYFQTSHQVFRGMV